MEPTSRGFSEVREVFFRELVEMSKNSLNGGGKGKLGDVSLHTNVTYKLQLNSTRFDVSQLERHRVLT